MNKHEEMQKYFAAIIKIAESNNEETCQAIQRVCIDASNFFERNFTEQEKEEDKLCVPQRDNKTEDEHEEN